ncbi:hypothetical protein BDP27DRAFT_1253294 [Rhodocollybia butyracea]|uniref:CUE domain-containing protein n=1 Tax=Rhodocollybia butyracea TaxID=206335 RepID=A0A9P5UGB5_9AGAR|nr:hypothetical protein BDP27DRAFT_1253294 [Rhodocollybia butyracea]
MVANESVATKLPPYPSAVAQKALSPSQRANLNETISSCIVDFLSLPPSKRNTTSACAFVASYAKDVAVQSLQALIWDTEDGPSKVEKTIRIQVLQLAEQLAIELDVFTLLDLAFIYASTNPKRTRALLEAANSSLSSTDLITPFISLLEFDNGLYTLRKTSHCISALFRVAPPTVVRAFAHSKFFILALANTYQVGLNSIAHSYGGISLDMNGRTTADDWEKIWLETKVSFMDSFHACMVCLLNDVTSASGRALAVEAETIFDIVFALLELNSTAGQAPTPFLNQSILADYQQSYDLMRTLSSSFRHAVERDARLDLLEESLKKLESGEGGKKNPGALKILLRSSGIPAGIDNRSLSNRNKGKGKEQQRDKEINVTDPTIPAPQSTTTDDPDLDIKISQVLDIFPDQPPDYIRDLLTHPSYPFAGNTDGAERVIGALLEGTTPPWDEVRNASKAAAALRKPIPVQQQPERKNIFDEEDIDLSKFRVGKKSDDEHTFLRNREFVEQMKADILRRVEEFSSSEEELDEDRDRDDIDEPSVANKIKVAGDGEESGASDEDGLDGEEPTVKPTLETILELAYIENLKVFDRDSTTRSSKAREDLRQKTGWEHEQIEGWRIMLDRDVSIPFRFIDFINILTPNSRRGRNES